MEYIKSDDEKISRLLEIESSEDPDYIQYENYGKLIECWIADNMKCPCCGELSLRRYSSDNFPIIDLICINQFHYFSHGVKFFQVKSSNGAPFMGASKYFSLNDRTIHVGSNRLGSYVHNIKFSDDDLDKKILIGYICVTHNGISGESCISKKYINMLLSKSFIVLPKLHFNVLQTELFPKSSDIPNTSYSQQFSETDHYYRYLENKYSTHPIIEFSTETNNILWLDKLILI